VFREIEDYVKSNPFFAFIKGSPDAPKCKFTRKLVDMFSQKGYRYKTCDILANDPIRNWLKFYSNWPTFPQVFLDGKFIGGVDIVTDLIESEEFDEMVPQVCKKLSPIEEWKQVVSQNPVVALIEGTIEQPLHLPSTEFVSILKKTGVRFVAVDVTQKPELLKDL
jgi:Grx4 family monothiol glutaredoxin